jgi:ferrous iron transport protein A
LIKRINKNNLVMPVEVVMLNEGHPNGEPTSAQHRQAIWHGFTYIREPLQRALELDQPTLTASHRPHSGLQALADMPVGDLVQIISLNCGTANRRFVALGLAPGTVLQVISKTATLSVIVALEHQQLGLGAEIAQRIQVTHLVSSAQHSDLA